jgi:hypothetical protein
MEISDGHPDRGQPLLAWAARALEDRGATVKIVDDGDANWIRRDPAADGDAPRFEVVVHGLANLLHELVHAAQHGRLADDHGVDYGLIPFDLGDPAVRRLVWEEMAAAVISCAYLPGDAAAIDGWFAEQVEIQGIFHGLAAADLEGLRRRLDDLLIGFADEAEAALERAYSRTESWLRAAGAPAEIARPPARWPVAALWGRYRGAWTPLRPPAAAPLPP